MRLPGVAVAVAVTVTVGVMTAVAAVAGRPAAEGATSTVDRTAPGRTTRLQIVAPPDSRAS